jgi:predicted DNA-binding transcriptional regulator YafY
VEVWSKVRASRLLSILLLLQSRGRMTAGELAAELEVSPRTVYRDLDDLGAAGVPVYGERGKGGGYHLLDGYRTNLTGLTAEEAGALLLSGAPAPAAELGLGTLLASTRLKLLAAVPPGLRETATRAEQRFHLDPAGWAHDRARDDRHLHAIARAVWNDRRLQIRYQRPSGSGVPREIDPLGLVHKTGTWYLVAARDGQQRVYRVDRMQDVREMEEPARRPAGFDLVDFWEAWEGEYAASLPTFAARVRLGPAAMRHRDNLGPLAPRGITEHAATGDGWVVQTLLYDDRRVAVSALLALAPEIEVIAPDELRDELLAVARQVLERGKGSGERHAGVPANADLRPWLGRTVSVTVDRPLGSAHPTHADHRYPVNYGYLPGTVSGDGEPIDAYVLGVDEPATAIEGTVIALIVRADDVEDKVVVAVPGMAFSAAEIRAGVEFQERFFQSTIVLADET